MRHGRCFASGGDGEVGGRDKSPKTLKVRLIYYEEGLYIPVEAPAPPSHNREVSIGMILGYAPKSVPGCPMGLWFNRAHCYWGVKSEYMNGNIRVDHLRILLAREPSPSPRLPLLSPSPPDVNGEVADI